MRIIRDLVGGILIITAAGALAIAQNAVRKDGIPLVPRATSVGIQEVRSSVSAGADSVGASGTASSSAASTAEELSSGVISKDRLRTLLDSGKSGEGGALVLIDARLPEEYEAGHIAGAINVPYGGLADYYDRLAETVPLGALIVCYCQSVTCDDSENLARELSFMGYRNVLLYKGGWDEWSGAGYPSAPAANE
jgi:rhodanese-related sulfurtransferase